MDLINILMFCVVGVSVIAFLLEEKRKSFQETDQRIRVRHDCDRSKAIAEVCVLGPAKEAAVDDDDDDGGDVEAEQKVLLEKPVVQQVEEAEAEADAENHATCENLDSLGGVLVIDENIVKDNNSTGFIEDDDWEGIERTDLEKMFGEAVVFLNCKSNADKIDGDLKLELYGLQKVALEGPCHGSQPMALKLSARANWNAWQKLGDMSRETAMEKYVNILSMAIPGWKVDGTFH